MEPGEYYQDIENTRALLEKEAKTMRWRHAYNVLQADPIQDNSYVTRIAMADCSREMQIFNMYFPPQQNPNPKFKFQAKPDFSILEKKIELDLWVAVEAVEAFSESAIAGLCSVDKPAAYIGAVPVKTRDGAPKKKLAVLASNHHFDEQMSEFDILKYFTTGGAQEIVESFAQSRLTRKVKQSFSTIIYDIFGEGKEEEGRKIEVRHNLDNHWNLLPVYITFDGKNIPRIKHKHAKLRKPVVHLAKERRIAKDGRVIKIGTIESFFAERYGAGLEQGIDTYKGKEYEIRLDFTGIRGFERGAKKRIVEYINHINQHRPGGVKLLVPNTIFSVSMGVPAECIYRLLAENRKKEEKYAGVLKPAPGMVRAAVPIKKR